MKKLSIVIPAYNEEKTIQKIVELVKKADELMYLVKKNRNT
jgi:glycosyltransferase involved in cell wall biosynthesis